MTIIDEKEKAERNHAEAKGKLEMFVGKWEKRLEELLGGAEENRDGEFNYLKVEKERLEASKERWEMEVMEWNKKLREVESKGNERIV